MHRDGQLLIHNQYISIKDDIKLKDEKLEILFEKDTPITKKVVLLMNKKRNEILEAMEEDKDSDSEELFKKRDAVQKILYDYLFYYKKMLDFDTNADLAKRANLQS